MDIDRVIQKARDLLELKGRAGTEGEAQAAALALARLMERYRLEMVEIERDLKPENVVDEEPILKGRRISRWRRRLIEVLEKHYGVASFWRRNGIQQVILCGRPDDLRLLRLMHTFISEESMSLGRQYSEGQGRHFTESWRSGFIDGIEVQLKRVRKEEHRKVPKTSAIVLRDRHEKAREALLKLVSNVSPISVKVKFNLNHRAYNEGHTRGQVHHLGARLESKEDEQDCNPRYEDAIR